MRTRHGLKLLRWSCWAALAVIFLLGLVVFVGSFPVPVSRAAVSFFMAANAEEPTVPFIADLVLKGEDVTQYWWAWLHQEGQGDKSVRMYIEVSKYLLERLDALQGEEKTRANSFLCDGGLGNPLKQCTKDAIVARLAALEKMLELHKRSSKDH